jgi:cation diffusion facilitator CzcD-associated flavoprotein CzcO
VETVLVGAGLAGLYAAHGLRTANIDFQGIEAAPAVGGTWYWNRYPGCRCDAPSIEYSYGFDPELEQSWSFSESMAAQPEIERYLNHVADRHGLRQHFHFGTRVLAAHYDETRHRWTVTTDRGDTYSARWCIMATGPLSAPNSPAIPGVESFAGQILHTARWPTSPVSFAGKRVGVIGTGSSGIQVIPQIAATARQLWVFQRTANYTLPADLVPMDPGFERHIKAHYREIRRRQRSSKLGISGFTLPAMFAGGEARPVGEGALPDLSVFSDPVLTQQRKHNFACMVRERVHDPRTADTLIPTD